MTRLASRTLVLALAAMLLGLAGLARAQNAANKKGYWELVQSIPYHPEPPASVRPLLKTELTNGRFYIKREFQGQRYAFHGLWTPGPKVLRPGSRAHIKVVAQQFEKVGSGGYGIAVSASFQDSTVTPGFTMAGSIPFVGQDNMGKNGVSVARVGTADPPNFAREVLGYAKVPEHPFGGSHKTGKMALVVSVGEIGSWGDYGYVYMYRWKPGR